MTQLALEDIERTIIGIVVDIYARVSTDIQEEDGTSLDTQVANCLERAAARGYKVGKIFREVFTGSLYRERPLLSEARMRYRNGDSQGLLFNTFDRLSRNQIHLGVLIDEMQHYNVLVECVKETFDTSPAGQFMRNALAFVAEVERTKIIERTDDGRRKRAKDGKMLGWHSPRYGYSWNEDRTAYIINEKEAAVVKRIYAMALQGISIHTIAATLTREGVPPRGKRGKNGVYITRGVWMHSTVHKILQWPGYTGEAYVYVTRQQKVNGHRHTTYRPDDEVIKLPAGVIPALIDPDTSATVKAQLQLNKERALRNNQHPEDTLLRAGLVKCGYCDRNAVVTRRAGKKPCYRCKSSGDPERGVCKGFIVTADIADAAAWEEAVAIINDPQRLAQKLQGKKRKNPTDEEFEPINRKLKDNNKEVQNLMKLARHAQDDDYLETLGKLLAQLEREKKGLLQEQKKLQNIDELHRQEQQALAAFEERCAVYRQKLAEPNAEFTYEQKREALEYFGIKALVWRHDHKPQIRIVSSRGNIVSPMS